MASRFYFSVFADVYRSATKNQAHPALPKPHLLCSSCNPINSAVALLLMASLHSGKEAVGTRTPILWGNKLYRSWPQKRKTSEPATCVSADYAEPRSPGLSFMPGTEFPIS